MSEGIPVPASVRPAFRGTTDTSKRVEVTADEVEAVRAAQWVKATESFFGVDAKGREINIAAGQTVRSNHPAVAGHENLFEPLDDQPTPTTSGRGRNRAPAEA